VKADFAAGVAMKCENEALSGADVSDLFQHACDPLLIYVCLCMAPQHTALFTSKFDLTFIDNSGRLNLFARVTCDAYEEVRVGPVLETSKSEERGGGRWLTLHALALH